MSHDLTDFVGPVHELINTHQSARGLTDEHFAHILGFKSTKPLQLIKSGSMMLPIAMVAGVARCLDLPADQLLRRYLSEKAPEVLRALEECLVVPQANVVESAR